MSYAEDRGVRIGNECLAFVKASERMRPLGDHIVVEPLPANPTIIIDCWRTVRGKVLAAGKGHYPIIYLDSHGDRLPDHRRSQRKAMTQSKHFVPMPLKIGDVVDLGGREIGGYLNQTIRWGDKEVVVCRAEDVALIVES